MPRKPTDLNITQQNRLTTLQEAAISNDITAFLRIVNDKKFAHLLDEVDSDGNTVLHLAALHDAVDIINAYAGPRKNAWQRFWEGGLPIPNWVAHLDGPEYKHYNRYTELNDNRLDPLSCALFAGATKSAKAIIQNRYMDFPTDGMFDFQYPHFTASQGQLDVITRCSPGL